MFCNFPESRHKIVIMTVTLLPQVRKERDGKIVDAKCHALIAPHVRERYASDPTDVSISVCPLYEEFDRNGREGRPRFTLFFLQETLLFI